MQNTFKRKSSALSVLLVLLIMLDAASLVLLFGRISAYSSSYVKNVIPLTESRSSTSVTEMTRSEWKKFSWQSSGEAADAPSAIPAQISHDPSLEVRDDDKIWVSETNVEIFHLAYSSENGVTVKSSDGTKMLAPGTSNEYVFTLENTGGVLLDYAMTMEAYVSGIDYKLPVSVSVHDHTDNYLLGSESEKADVLELNGVSDNAKLSPGRFAIYTLEWEWPFESGSDEYDTMLGNMAVDNDIVLNVKINTYAEYDETISPAGSDVDSASSGDDDNRSSDSSRSAAESRRSSDSDVYGVEDPSASQVVFKTGVVMSMIPVVVFTISLIAMLLTVRPRKSDEDEEEPQ